MGAGEILITSIDREGSWKGFDFEITKEICDSVSIPVIANGGCSSIQDIRVATIECNASAVGVGSMFVFQKKGMEIAQELVFVWIAEEPVVNTC